MWKQERATVVSYKVFAVIYFCKEIPIIDIIQLGSKYDPDLWFLSQIIYYHDLSQLCWKWKQPKEVFVDIFLKI